MKKKKITTLWICLVLVVILCAIALFLETMTAEQLVEETQHAGETKDPDMYTWEEYQALSLEEQDTFFQTFDSVDTFEAWMEEVNPAESIVPVLNWDKAGKQPDNYTWEEYQELSPEEQDAFFQWFDSVVAFEEWMEAAKPDESTTPIQNWDKPDKLPNEYTWAEYQALSLEDQDAFYLWFGSVEDFEAWMEAVKPDESTTPIQSWDKPEKLPNQYTWEEYQALSPEDQDAFYLWFDSVEDFEAWMEAVKPDESTTPIQSWDKPGKLPNEYTWEEYQALSPEDQDAFFLWFGSVEDFEAWMNIAMEK